MAFISEIHYRSGDVVANDPSTHEFVEITLGPGDDPADFVFSFYGADSTLMVGPDVDIQATGVVDAEVALSSLTGVPDPEHPDWTVYTVTATGPSNKLINGGSAQAKVQANYVALTNISTGEVESAVGVGGNAVTTLQGGAADGGVTINAPAVGAGQTVQFDSDGNNVSGPQSQGTTEIVCFAAGTRISVPSGWRAVEDLDVGDEVLTLSNGAQKIRWIGQHRLTAAQLAANEKLRPIRITQGAMGHGLPTHDLLVSRQHRMLIASRIAERMFGAPMALVAAFKLTDTPGIGIDSGICEVDYYHLLLDRHEVIFANGAPTESLYLGDHVSVALSPQSTAEISEILAKPVEGSHQLDTAAHMPTNRQQRNLSHRHAKNRVPLLERLKA